MTSNPLLHFLIMGNAGRNKYFVSAGKFLGYFQGKAAFAAAASTYYKYLFLH
jgi:hypothetical protein